VKKTTRLRQLLQSPELEFLLEAHNALSAKIAEEAGFPAIWASGLSMSAQFGVRDSNEASWSQVVDALEFMSDATQVPILVDGDTGYGNFNSLRRLVRKLEQRQLAGVCIEDKEFPKTNSFGASDRQILASADEFCGKIKAAKDSQLDADFVVVARVEALIAGAGMEEALRRAEAYHGAGADAVLIHSKKTRADEVVEFARHWAGRCPLVIVPTKYYSTPVEVFRKAGFSLVIWANHLLRASIPAMQSAARRIRQSQGVVAMEDQIAGLEEVFRLQGADELAQAERTYAPAPGRGVQAVLLAASRGRELESLTVDRPKAMLQIAGKPILERLVEECRRQGIHSIQVVAGYRAETVALEGVSVVVNADHENTGEIASLRLALPLEGQALILYGDLLMRSSVLRDLLELSGEAVAVVDSLTTEGPDSDYAQCSAPDDRSLFGPPVTLQRMVTSDKPNHGRWIGLLRLGGAALQSAHRVLERMPDGSISDLINALVEADTSVQVHYIHGHWLDVNRLEDLEKADAFARA
jgi:phosphoenolpyruvate phosphomutase